MKGIFWDIFPLMSIYNICGILLITTDNNLDLSLSLYEQNRKCVYTRSMEAQQTLAGSTANSVLK